MIYLEVGLLVAMLVIGSICAWTDFKTGKVPNRYLLISFFVGFLLHGAIIAIGGGSYYLYWGINMLIADAIAFLMYIGKIWAAGDTKLFMLLYYLVPPFLIEAENLSFSITPFIFIFLPSFLWVLIDTIWRLYHHEPHKKLPPVSIPRFFLDMLIMMVESTALSCLVITIFPTFFQKNELLSAVVMIIYAFFCSKHNIMRKWYSIAIHCSVVGVVYVLNNWQFSIPNWRSYFLLISLVLIQRFAMLYNYQRIPTDSIKEGMIISMDTVLMFSVSRVHDLPMDASEELSAAISSKQAEAVKRWGKTERGEKNIWIVRKTAFAIMIFIGFILWIGIRAVR